MSDQIFNIKDHKSQIPPEALRVGDKTKKDWQQHQHHPDKHRKKRIRKIENKTNQKNLTTVCSIDLGFVLFFFFASVFYNTKMEQQQQK